MKILFVAAMLTACVFSASAHAQIAIDQPVSKMATPIDEFSILDDGGDSADNAARPPRHHRPRICQSSCYMWAAYPDMAEVPYPNDPAGAFPAPFNNPNHNTHPSFASQVACVQSAQNICNNYRIFPQDWPLSVRCDVIQLRQAPDPYGQRVNALLHPVNVACH